MSATQLLSATATALNTAEVTLGNSGSPAAAADNTAFDPTKWSFVPDPNSGPVYTPAAVLSAVAKDATNEIVILTIDQELTPGVVYTAEADGVTGITVDGTHNVVAFVSKPITSAPSDRDFAMIDFMPRINLAEDDTGDLARFIACLQEPTNLLFDAADRWVEILDCDLAPEQFLDAILADLGNPFQFTDPLSVVDKRKLCRLLVAIYESKGTTSGVQAAVQFFVGLRSELLSFTGLGDKLATTGHTSGFGKLSRSGSGGTAVPSFRLGTGTAYQFYFKIGTVLDASIVGSGSGTNATSKQADRALKILQIMKPAGLILRGVVRSGAEPTQRSAIKDNGAGTVDLIMAPIANSEAHLFLEAGAPGVNPFNAGAQRAASGSPPTVSGLTPTGNTYWNGIGKNNDTGNLGLLSNEVTNALTKPVLTATAAARSIVLTWPAVTGATSYLIYKGVASFASPVAADNAQAPIEVTDLEFVDELNSGDVRYYMITPVQGANFFGVFPNAFASEGFFSDIKTATAL